MSLGSGRLGSSSDAGMPEVPVMDAAVEDRVVEDVDMNDCLESLRGMVAVGRWAGEPKE